MYLNWDCKETGVCECDEFWHAICSLSSDWVDALCGEFGLLLSGCYKRFNRFQYGKGSHRSVWAVPHLPTPGLVAMWTSDEWRQVVSQVVRYKRGSKLFCCCIRYIFSFQISQFPHWCFLCKNTFRIVWLVYCYVIHQSLKQNTQIPTCSHHVFPSAKQRSNWFSLLLLSHFLSPWVWSQQTYL